jgi:tripartite-type tricarboxylate transporter receptor subunit TctC
MTRTSLAALAVGLAMAPLAAQADDPMTYYEGQTIRVIIPFSAGGGTDTFGRYIANHLGRHIPGNPTVVAENVTGAGGLLGANEYAQRVDRDGLTLFTASGHMNLRMFVRLEGLALQLDELDPVVAAPMGHITAVHASTGIDSPQMLFESEVTFTKGITDPVGLVESIVTLEAMGIEYNAIPGYGGRGDTRIDFERGELTINTQSTPAYLASVVPLVEEGEVYPLYAVGFVNPDGSPMRDPAAPDIPTALELWLEHHGEATGEAWDAYRVIANLVQNTRGTLWVHSDAPDAAKEALRIGVDAMVEDPDFIKDGEAILAGYEVISGAGLDQIRADLDAAPPEVVTWVQTMLTDRFGVQFDTD